MPEITFVDVAKQYGRDRYAVERLNLDLPDGSFTAILGPSGCGKTTTLRMLAGLEQPTAGSILVGGRVLSSVDDGIFVPPHQRELGLVFQNYALWPHMSVWENIEFGLRIKKASREERKQRVGEMLELLHVSHLAERIPAQLSGGEQQRVAIARALAPSPSLVLFDEPLSNLDAPLRLELSAELKRLHLQLGMTAILVTHDQAEAMAVATQIVVMRSGSIEQVGSPFAIYGTPETVHVARFIGSPPMNLVNPSSAFGELRDEASRLYGVSPEKVDLLGARPEHIGIGEELPGIGISCAVESVMITGSSAIVHLTSSDGCELLALVSNESQIFAGDEVNAKIEPHRVHLFGGDGARLSLGISEAPGISFSDQLAGRG